MKGDEKTLKNDQKMLVALFEKGYSHVVNGDIPGMDSAKKLAADYQKDHRSKLDAAKALVRWQNLKCAVDGFVTGVPGLPLLPATLPANIVTTYIVHIQTVASIAVMGGYDLEDDRVKTLVLMCLAGDSVDKILRPIGLSAAQLVAKGAINAIPRSILGRINAMVGAKLVTKFSEKGVIQLGRFVPFAGGAVGALVDGVASNLIGNAAIQTFIKNEDCVTA